MSDDRDERPWCECSVNGAPSTADCGDAADERVAAFTHRHPWVTRTDDSADIELPDPDEDHNPGEALQGILSHVDIDPVESVREIREP
jgi:hypothetical protein